MENKGKSASPSVTVTEEPRGQNDPEPVRLNPAALARIRQLMNANSGRWRARGVMLYRANPPDSTGGEEQRLALCDEPDVAELIALLHKWFWPLVNEITMLQRRLADVRAERRALKKEILNVL